MIAVLRTCQDNTGQFKTCFVLRYQTSWQNSASKHFSKGSLNENPLRIIRLLQSLEDKVSNATLLKSVLIRYLI